MAITGIGASLATLITARSVRGSCDTSVAETVFPEASVTSIRRTPSTTW